MIPTITVFSGSVTVDDEVPAKDIQYPTISNFLTGLSRAHPVDDNLIKKNEMCLRQGHIGKI